MIPEIVFQNVAKRFTHDDKTVVAIEDISFTIHQGEYVCILGRSGCGKSTAINLLLGLMRPDRGEVRVRGVDPHDDFDALRGRLGCIFQSDRLLAWRTALENVLLPLEILKVQDRALWDRAPQWLARFGLAGFEHAHPAELSGGMRQRASLARALASDPDILLADEAFGHLDAATGEKLRRDFKTVAIQGKKTVIHVTHSIDEALELSDRIFVLGRPGRILAIYDRLDIVSENDRARTRNDILDLLREDGWSEDESQELLI